MFFVCFLENWLLTLMHSLFTGHLKSNPRITRGSLDPGLGLLEESISELM